MTGLCLDTFLVQTADSKMGVIVRGPPLCDKDCSVILVEFVFVFLFNTFYFCARFINKDHAGTWQKRKHSHLNPAAE